MTDFALRLSNEQETALRIGERIVGRISVRVSLGRKKTHISRVREVPQERTDVLD